MDTITISEFRHWLAGVEEMQPDGWSPDKRQWDRIREKINQLEAVVPAPVVQQVVQQPVPVYRDEPIANIQPQYASPGLHPRAVAPPPNNALFANADMQNVPVRTPNVDTSTGNYESAFM